MGEMFIWSNLGQNPLEIDIRSCARIMNAIWDQLLAIKAEIVRFCSLSKGIFDALKRYYV